MEQPNYTKQLLLQLNQQRSRGYLCDVIIVVENALFRAHKNILAACSSYFNSLLLRDNLITLDTQMVKPSVFRQVLDFIYTGQLPSSHQASDEGVSALLRAASYLQLSHLAALCHRKLNPCGPSDSPSSASSSRVVHSDRSGSTEDGKSRKQTQRKDLLEEKLFTARCASPELAEMNDSVESSLHSSSNSASSDDILFIAEQWHQTADSQQIGAHKRSRSSRDDCLDGRVGAKRQEVDRRQKHADVKGEDLALKRELKHSEESKSEGKELNGNKQASYIYQPQPGFALQGSLYMCIPCGEGFPSSEQLIAHVESHAAEQLVEDAEERRLVKVDVRDPQRIIRPTRPFPCDICGKLFTQRGTMTRHMRSHLGLKPFACDECGMRFTRQYRKIEHMRIHTREKPYECRLCGVKFTQQRSIISHLKMHTVLKINQVESN